MPNKEYKKLIAQYLNTDANNVFLYWKGRVGLYAILKAIGIEKGDEIIVPAFTCVVVSNAIMYLGAKPIYVDIDPRTYNLDTNKLSNAITSQTKVIISQNTFGLSPDYDMIVKIAEKYNLFIIEDSTHGFGGTYKQKPNGMLADATFFSTQWNKPFSTGIGGFVVCKDDLLSEKIKDANTEAVIPGYLEGFILELLILARHYLLKPSIYWQLLKLYRFLSRNNLVIGSSSGEEIIGIDMPDKYFRLGSKVQSKYGIQGVKEIEQITDHRVRISSIYDSFFIDNGFGKLFTPKYAKHTYIKYAFFVKDQDSFIKKAEKAKIPLGDWFTSPLYPVLKDFDIWLYNYGDFPKAERISRHILNLPTDIDISEKFAGKIVRFLEANKGDLLPYSHFYK